VGGGILSRGPIKNLNMPEMGSRSSSLATHEAELLVGRRPADILLMNWSRGQHVAVDIVCTHEAGVALHPPVVEHTAKHWNRAEIRKYTRMALCVRQRGWGSPHSP